MAKETVGLTPANENPWYVLMTLYGEQEGDEIDWELHKANRENWNTLIQSISGGMAERASEVIVGLPSRDQWRDVHQKITKQWRDTFENRNGNPWPDVFDFRTFPTNLSNQIFPSQLCLDGFFMPKGAIFDRSTFANGLTSRNAFWGNLVSLIDATVVKNIDLSGTTFEDVITARNLQVSGSLKLIGTTTKNFVDLSGVKVEQEIDAKKMVVEGEFRCAKLTGGQWSSFNSISIGSNADFDRATFGSVTFGNARFSEFASFWDTDFGQYVSFLGARFEGACDFRDAKFHGKADFAGALFSNFAKFQNTVFGVSLEDTKIERAQYPRADFTDSQFLYPVSFRGTKFLSTFPILRGAQLHPRSDFTAEEDHWVINPLQDPDEAKEACATIRHALAKQGMPEEEHFFFRREMAFASQIGGWWRRLPYRGFAVFSNYGESISRPIRALVELFVLGAAAFFGYFLIAKGWIAALGLAAAVSFSNLLPLFGFGRTYLRETLLELPWYLQAMAAAQTVLALPLLFFLGLALRKRFRLR